MEKIMYEDLIYQITKYLKPIEKYYLVAEYGRIDLFPSPNLGLGEMTDNIYGLDIYLIYRVNNIIKIKQRIFNFCVNNDVKLEVSEENLNLNFMRGIKIRRYVANQYNGNQLIYIFIDKKNLILKTVGGNSNSVTTLLSYVMSVIKEEIAFGNGEYYPKYKKMFDSGLNIMEYKINKESIKFIDEIMDILIKKFSNISSMDKLEESISELNDIERKYIIKNY